MRMRMSVAVALVAIVCGTGVAGAQDRGVVMVGAAFSPSSLTFSDNRVYTLYREPATFSVDYDLPGGAGIDIGGFGRFWRNFGGGVALTTASRSGSAVVNASLPHPFFFNRPRAARLDVNDIARGDTTLHLSAAWMPANTGRLSLVVFGGPSIHAVSMDVADNTQVADAYPYDAVALTAGTLGEWKERLFGLHVGTDAAYYFTEHIGLGALVRITAGSKDVSIGTGEPFTLKMGSLQAAAGLRFRF